MNKEKPKPKPVKPNRAAHNTMYSKFAKAVRRAPVKK